MTKTTLGRRVAGVVAGAMILSSSAVMAMAEGEAEQQYRPHVHFSPEENWMNDPNGMVYIDGMYHLFYQHNPYGNDWGNMSWGHATSDDLLHWTQQPVAIPQTFNDDGVPIEDIFSGSVVIDHDNTAGFGEEGDSPLVAIYTSAYTNAHPEYAGIQAQSLAYSLDDGFTWTKYEENPVLDRNSPNFRDPKVFWYEGDNGEAYWVMVAVEATDYEVVLYRSDDLKDWDYLSTFGPANSVGGIWECPDLFELPVEGGEPGETKWVMVVNLNPGAVGGGSGGQYFVGDFDGTTFTSETTVVDDVVPEGTVFEDFEGDNYDGWTVNNEDGHDLNGPFGDAPAQGTLPPQGEVTGYIGDGLVNSFLGEDWPIGSMESDPFVIEDAYINFLIAGGNHPHVPGGQEGNDPPVGARVLFDFEHEENLEEAGWTLTGDFEADLNPSTAGGDYYIGEKRLNTWEGGPDGDGNQGLLTSPEFDIDADYISFLIGGGGRNDGSLQVELLVDGDIVRTATGPNAGALNWENWDVSEFAGQQGRFQVRDEATGGWGHLTVDHIVIADEPAQVRSSETTVNLIVDGEVVRSATGNNSESLDWASWDVSEFEGEQAHIRIVDNNRFDWGVILVDHIMFADEPVESRLRQYDWLDWGRDYYATVSYSDTPGDSRIMHGWMNNWDYAGDTPTATWRSAMTLAREVTLVQTPAGPRLQQQVVDYVDDILDTANAESVSGVTVDGDVALGLSGDVVKLELVLDPGSAQRAGINVFEASTGEAAQIGYDASTGNVFVDRRDSGNTDFNANFASIQTAPVDLDADGNVTLEIYLDRASVELFANDGRITITDLVFPLEGADGISAWSEGGAATIVDLTVTPLQQTMFTERPQPVTTADVTDRVLTLEAEAFDTEIFRIDYRIENGEWQRYTGPVEFAGEDDVEVTFRAVDRRGVFGEEDTVIVSVDEEEPVDVTDLEAAIADAESRDAADYTAESWADVEEALAAAHVVLVDEDVTQAEVDEATAALTGALADLVLVDNEQPPGDDVQPPGDDDDLPTTGMSGGVAGILLGLILLAAGTFAVRKSVLTRS